jgi:hypothetical protein
MGGPSGIRGEMINANRILVGNSEGKKTLGRSRCI